MSDDKPNLEIDPWDKPNPIRLFRCMECGCTNADFDGEEHCMKVLEKGTGLRRNSRLCQRLHCPCHTEYGRTRIVTKVLV